MAVTIKWLVLQKPIGDIGHTDSYEIADADSIVEVIDNGDGTVSVYYIPAAL